MLFNTLKMMVIIMSCQDSVDRFGDNLSIGLIQNSNNISCIGYDNGVAIFMRTFGETEIEDLMNSFDISRLDDELDEEYEYIDKRIEEEQYIENYDEEQNDHVFYDENNEDETEEINISEEDESSYVFDDENNEETNISEEDESSYIFDDENNEENV